MMKELPDPIGVVPHRAPSLLVTGVAERLGESLRCLGRVSVDHPCAVGGLAPAVLAVEFAAQAAAVLFGMERLDENPTAAGPEKGYLVSLRHVILNKDLLPVERELEAEVAVEGRFGPMALCSFRVLLDEVEIATGRFGVTD